MTVQPDARAAAGRLHPALRVGLYLPTLFGALAILSVLAGGLWGLLAPLMASPFETVAAGSADQVAVLLVELPFLLATLAVTAAFRRWLDRRDVLSLGLQPTAGWLAEAALGFALGALLMALILAVELTTGGYRLVGGADRGAGLGSTVTLLLSGLVLYLVVALNEELIARGYLLQNLSLAWGRPAGVLISSALFALAHGINPGAGPISIVALLFAGLLLATAYLASGRLWLPIGLHLSWNFFQGPVFGFPVSGLAEQGLLRLEPVGPVALTGGQFGPEASLVGVAAELIGLGLLWLGWRRARATGPAR